MSQLEAMSNADTAWLHMDQPTNLMVVCGVMVLDRRLTADRLKQILRDRLLQFDRFRQRVVEDGGAPAWEEDPLFDLDAHVHRIGLPAPGGQRELEEVVADLLATPLDPSKSPWQVHLVDRFGKGSAMIMRLHHCIADGIALVRVLLSMTDTAPHLRRPRPETDNPLWALFRPAAAVATAATAAAQALLHEGVELFRHPPHAMEIAREGVDVARTLARLALLPPDSDTIFRGPLGVKKRVAWVGGTRLADVKHVGHALGATVNDVLLCALAGALRRYLRDRRRPVSGVDIRLVVPVDLRPIEDVPRLGNHFGLVFVDLPVGIRDAAARLQEIVRRTQAMKHSLDAPLAFAMLQAIGMASAPAEHQLLDAFSSKATMVVTNVPGPRKKLYLGGAGLARMMFWVPQSGRIGLGLSILSYDHEVSVGITADAGLVPDPQLLLRGMREELTALAKIAAASRRRRAPRRKGRGVRAR
ncbi:MAG TPA: wax ester/triacylglycerol synthase family O-acyltransferase [Candidatus Dormibacteraeota bacterium]|nr:wax ester/triacylglycerol synthase family O-acyltransferase [Candidatus Dormibacteraeota bacterium]